MTPFPTAHSQQIQTSARTRWESMLRVTTIYASPRRLCDYYAKYLTRHPARSPECGPASRPPRSGLRRRRATKICSLCSKAVTQFGDTARPPFAIARSPTAASSGRRRLRRDVLRAEVDQRAVGAHARPAIARSTRHRGDGSARSPRAVRLDDAGPAPTAVDSTPTRTA